MGVIGKLNALTVPKKPAGMYGDGGGLWLQVRRRSRSWLFRYTSPVTGRERLMGLGGVDVVGLAEARDIAGRCRRLLHEGKDPLDEKRAADTRSAAAVVTFREAAEGYIAVHTPAWRNAKHAEQWRSTLAAYVFPQIGDLPVAAVDTEAVLRVLKPVWYTRPETARRLCGRIEAVLGAAAVQGWRSSENPARWRGHLSSLLPARGKAAAVRHHPAVPWQDVGRVMAALRERGGLAPIALRFLVLTAGRSGEVRGARWSEIDLGAAVWTVPGARMKAGQPHRVPLSEPTLEIVRQAGALRAAGDHGDGLVFPGQVPARPLSDAALSAVLSRVAPGATVHGFRSSFRDWCAESTAYPGEVAEQALAHVVSDKTEAAYRRGDLFEKRRALMADWARHCMRAADDRATAAGVAPRETDAAGPREQSADTIPVASAAVAVVAADLSEFSRHERTAPAEWTSTPEADFPPPAPGLTEEAASEWGFVWGEADYRLVCRALFLMPELVSASKDRWLSYQGRYDDQFAQIPLFTVAELRELLLRDPRVAMHWREFPRDDAAVGSFIIKFDDAFACALAAARQVARGTPEKFAAACERFGALAGDLLNALEPGADVSLTPEAPAALDILRRGAALPAGKPEDAAMFRALESVARELARVQAQPEAAGMIARRPGARGGISGPQAAIEQAITQAVPELSRLLRFAVLLTKRAKDCPFPQTRLANNSNFERAFLQVLFEQLVLIFEHYFSVPRALLTARDRNKQPRGLATTLAKGLIRIAAGKIATRLASNAEWPAEDDGRHPAIEAVKKAAALGDFAIASRIKKARVAWAARAARGQPAIAPARDDAIGRHGRGKTGRPQGGT